MQIKELIEKQRSFFMTGETKSLEFRLRSLRTLREGIAKFEAEIALALKADLNKAPLESFMTETGIVLSEIDLMLKKLGGWMRPKRVRTPLPLFHAQSMIMPEPYGVVLIMSPWNYPFALAIDPLVGALAAGNTAVVKPASYAKATSLVIEKLLKYCFEEEYVATVLGGREENQQLLDQHFDYIFFTGSMDVGRLVMEKASRHLTPISLELGGKSPCIVDSSADLELAAKRIAFGKFINAGQTCIAPDYVLIREKDKPAFIKGLKKAITDFFGEEPLKSEELPKIINEKHYNRLLGLMQSETAVIGGKGEGLKIAPTVLDGISWNSPVMQEEIFGPILPMITFTTMEEVYREVSSRGKPLALYLFSRDKRLEREVFDKLSFGGATINDTLMHFATSEMGFGGVGSSGMGRYHGKYSFDTFSNQRSVLKRSNWIDLSFRYHPYTEKKHSILKKYLK